MRNEITIGDRVFISAEVSEIRSNGVIIVRTSTGDYFGVDKEAVKTEEEMELL